ncbi:hypothetical protein [Microvirga makkahensis]|uniref:Uncharacterized protein n=1 Tax=Microvirga makkahensis TaxID=1128670 RepID=A0A7X3SNQ7_9HYPH|nr:hypothetical protein [Microvirga makkahensis]MXQ11661.1 hypothetical protein [Microvirga makkahensis]
MATPIADLISDFSSPAASEGIGIGVLRRVRQNLESDQVAVQSTADHQAELIRSIEERVRAEEREAARERLENALKAEYDRHCKDLVHQREKWVEQEAQQLSSQISTAMADLESLLSESAARILASVIPEALRQKAIAEFNEAIGTILSGNVSTLLRVTGPKDMLEALKAGVTVGEGVVEFVPGDAAEVTLIAEQTTVQTQLSTWSERLRTFLKAEPAC